MIDLAISSFGQISLHHVVSDFTGTLSVDGRLLDGVSERIIALAPRVRFHVLTADTFGTARSALAGLPVTVQVLTGPREDEQKAACVQHLNPEHVFAMGNGNNDSRMLSLARIGVAVINAEGASTRALQAAHLVVSGPDNALDLLLNPKRLIATLRH
jgi:P-type E1-E2 ATPase